ncbi:hypothetical protein BLNAU_17992 [Blattamonas nauphoetae]|uniref:Uncharacterized protein n=1 Tax=Blattamonas nauphoetae TaxID=2049346 RepID=A0ABQ9X5L6_9EUKA|nr:hypothetical protein BLNAU_17992 [Blattamonas nauphoetae]
MKTNHFTLSESRLLNTSVLSITQFISLDSITSQDRRWSHVLPSLTLFFFTFPPVGVGCSSPMSCFHLMLRLRSQHYQLSTYPLSLLFILSSTLNNSYFCFLFILTSSFVNSSF